ncbi:MAG TPA: segregation/condensation protein A [Nitrospirota bacterium]|jgi:segregation and condensation protein A
MIDDNYSIKLPLFEGPLDLLLHLIKKNEVDIYDIPIVLIVDQYIEYIELMKDLNLEIAGEFLVMAATLAQIKSRMLLPPREGENGEEDGQDPRQLLIDRLLEYKKFKEAAQELGERETFWREVFVRQGKGAWEDAEEPVDEQLFNFGLIDLLDAFKRVLKNSPSLNFHEIGGGDGISITDRINQILEMLEGRESITFDELFEGAYSRQSIIVSFLALLELARLKAIKVLQVEEFGTIRITKAVAEDGV